MSHSTDVRATHPDGRHDAGFSLIEVVVALGLFTLVVTALLPQLIVGIAATSTANKETVLKSLVQGELEQLRGLPYRVAPDADDDVVEYIDVLDLHYPDREPPGASPVCAADGMPSLPQQSWAGFVEAPAVRCAYEPQVGPFYRTVRLATRPDLGAVGVVIDLQFLSAGTSAAPAGLPLAPGVDYNSLEPTQDTPPSPQIGATVTVIYHDRGAFRSRSAYTQIAQRLVSPTRLRTRVDVEALRVSARRPDGAVVSLSAGVVNLNAALSHASTASANVAAVAASLSTGSPATSQAGYGAVLSRAAPPVTSLSPASEVGSGLGDPCVFVCWGDTRLGSLAAPVTSDDARPEVGSPTAPAQAMLVSLDHGGVSFDSSADPGNDYRLDITSPLVRFTDEPPATFATLAGCAPGADSTAYLTGSGFLEASPAETSPATVRACGLAGTSRISILATPWAPGGVVRVSLTSASANCQVTGGTGSGSSAYNVTVEVADGEGGYRTPITVSSSGGSLPAPSTFSLGEHGSLDAYIDSWSTPGITSAASGNPVEVEFESLTIATKPVRKVTDSSGAASPDPDSTVSLTVGAVSCSATDVR